MIKELVELQKSGAITKKELAEKVAELRLPKLVGLISKHITFL